MRTGHRCDITFKGGIAIWEGPIVCLMFVQLLKTNVRPLHVSYGRSVFLQWLIYSASLTRHTAEADLEASKRLCLAL